MADMKDAPFVDREDAARKLLPLLTDYKNSPDVVVLGLSRGGTVLAKYIAEELNLPLDVVVVKKIVVPTNVEFAVGAVTEDDISYFDWNLIKNLNLSKKYIDDAAKENLGAAKKSAEIYRKIIPIKDLRGKIAIIVDDGIATGASIQAAIRAAEGRGAAKIVIAAPVASRDSIEINKEAVDVVCPLVKDPFWAPDEFYSRFPKVDDDEVVSILKNYVKEVAH